MKTNLARVARIQAARAIAREQLKDGSYKARSYQRKKDNKKIPKELTPNQK